MDCFRLLAGDHQHAEPGYLKGDRSVCELDGINICHIVTVIVNKKGSSHKVNFLLRSK